MLKWTRWKKAYPGSCIYGDWPLCVVKKWKGQICVKITSFTIGPIWSPGNRNVEAWIEPHATKQWAFSPCKAKRAEHARPHTENERFGRWPVWPSEAETLGVSFPKKIPGVNGLRGTLSTTVYSKLHDWLGWNLWAIHKGKGCTVVYENWQSPMRLHVVNHITLMGHSLNHHIL